VQVVEARTGRRIPPSLTGALPGAAWSPDGNFLAAVADDNTVRLWEAATGRAGKTLEGKLDAPPSFLAWSADGTRLAGATSRSLWIWSAETGKLLWHNDKGESLFQAAWSPDGKQLAVTDLGDKGAVRTYEAETGKLLHEVPLRAWGLAWSPDGRWLAATPYGPGECLVIDAASGAVRARTRPGRDQRLVRWSADGKAFITIDHAGLQVWDAATGEHRRGVPLALLPAGATLSAWSPDGHVLAVGNPFQISLTDDNGLPLGELLPSDPFAYLAVTPDGHYRGSARAERLTRIVVQKRDGSSETLTPSEFEQKYGFKNDPAKVRLTE
jgi:WD40 repeat protein